MPNISKLASKLLRERFKWYRGEIGKLNSQIASMNTQALLMRSLFQKCPRCHNYLKLIEWNSTCAILTCIERGCDKYHTPINSVTNELLKELNLSQYVWKPSRRK